MPLRPARVVSSGRDSGRAEPQPIVRAVAWGGAIVFAGALLYFAYFYLVQLGRPVEGPAPALATGAAINVLLFSIFALHHSVFARSGVKAALASRVPRHLERSLYVWIASLLFLMVCLLWRPLPGVAWQAAGPGRWLLHAVQLGGLWLTLRSAARIDVRELAGIRPARARPPELTIRGAYRWVRHPIYLGWVLMVFGAPTMTTGRVLFAGISTLYLILAIPFEERSLTAEFGAAYATYQRQVRWRLIPGLW